MVEAWVFGVTLMGGLLGWTLAIIFLFEWDMERDQRRLREELNMNIDYEITDTRGSEPGEPKTRGSEPGEPKK